MSLHSSHNFKDSKDKIHHQDRLQVDLINSQHKIVLPKLSPEEHTGRRHSQAPQQNDNDSLFRIFKDQNTIDILRHKNINEFKHKSAHSKEEDLEMMMREIESQKDEIIKQMKIWTRVTESALMGEVKFGETDYSELHKSFYRWLLFIEQSYSSYQKIENTLPPPLIHQSPNAHINHYNEEMIKKSPHAHITHLRAQKEEHQKEVQKLNLIIKDLNSQLEIGQVKKGKHQSRIQELESFLSEQQRKNSKYQQRAKEVNKKIVDVVEQSQQFLLELKTWIKEGKDLKLYVQKLDKKLVLLQEYKQSFQ